MKMNWISRLADALRPTDSWADEIGTQSSRKPGLGQGSSRWSNVAALSGCLAAGCLASIGLNSTAMAQSPLAQAGSVSHDGQSYRVVPASQSGGLIDFPSLMDTTMTADSPFGISQVGHRHSQSCNSCGTQCGGNCGSSGYGSVTADGFTSGSCGECPKCIPYCYGIVEAVYMRRENFDERTLSAQFRLDEPDFDWAPRITIGQVPDCVNGIEASFTGPLRWEEFESRTDVDGLNPRLRVAPGALPDIVTLEAFGLDTDPAAAPAVTNADFQSLRRESTYWTFDSSRTMIAWDVAKFSFGPRFINLEDEFVFASQNEGVNGLISSQTKNRLVGAQVGLDIYNPTGRFSSTYFRGRAGAFLNLAETDFDLIHDGDIVLEQERSDQELAGIIELGTGVRYQVGEILAIRGGTELWYLTGVASTTDQFGSDITPNFGNRINIDDDVLFIGFSFGAELKY